jgi:hypothetical protein
MSSAYFLLSLQPARLYPPRHHRDVEPRRPSPLISSAMSSPTNASSAARRNNVTTARLDASPTYAAITKLFMDRQTVSSTTAPIADVRVAAILAAEEAAVLVRGKTSVKSISVTCIMRGVGAGGGGCIARLGLKVLVMTDRDRDPMGQGRRYCRQSLRKLKHTGARGIVNARVDTVCVDCVPFSMLTYY